jgi:hypothetical protein
LVYGNARAEVIQRVGDEQLENLSPAWKRLVSKPDVQGIHGTLFFQLGEEKEFHPTRKEEEMVVVR